jgi:hypothetical protein
MNYRRIFDARAKDIADLQSHARGDIMVRREPACGEAAWSVSGPLWSRRGIDRIANLFDAIKLRA